MRKILITLAVFVLTLAGCNSTEKKVLPGFCGYDTFIPELPKTGITEEFPSGFCGYNIFIPTLNVAKEESIDIQRKEQIQSDKQVESLEKVSDRQER